MQLNYDGKERLDENQLNLRRSILREQTLASLLNSYRIYLENLRLRDGIPPPPSAIQYLIETWRELRRRIRQTKA